MADAQLQQESGADDEDGTMSRSRPITSMYKTKHVFVELHEFRHDHWHETHRWNHGLQEHLERKGAQSSKHSKWTRPHLPAVSLFGMMALRESLTPDMVMLDVRDEDETLKPIVDGMVDRMVKTGKLLEDKRGMAHSHLLAHLTQRGDAIVARFRDMSVATVNSSRSQPQAAGNNNQCPELGLDTDITDMVRQRSWDSSLSATDALMPDADEEAVHILVDVVDWLDVAVAFFVRMEVAVDTGLEEEVAEGAKPRARFFLVVAGPPNEAQPRKYVEMGEAAAALLQDDTIVSVAYNARDPRDILAAIEQRFWKLRLMPDTTRPTPAGLKKRATKMLEQMENVKNERDNSKGKLKRSQTQKWHARQTEGFQDGISVTGFLGLLQKYAVPLLAGIALALFLANTEPEFYDKWAGYDHGDAGHGSSSSGSSHAHHGEKHPTMFGLSLKGHAITLHFIINDICMALFFGLATKEITEALQPGGSLYPPTRTTVNVLASTVGGVAGPVFVYILTLAVLTSLGLMDDSYSFADYAYGWGIPTATDISLAWVTALCVFGAGHPAINYLLLLAIVDDGIGLMIIAFAYPDPSNPVKPAWLLVCLCGSLIAYILRRLRCTSWKLYIMLAGPVAWFGLLWAALHPSLALVFVVPFIPMHITNENLDLTWLTSKSTNAADWHSVEEHDHHHPLHEFEEAVKNFVDFFVLFAFGACNAGVKMDSIGPLTWVVLFALIAGKTLGIFTASAVATCFGCPPPKGMSKSSVAIVGFIASAGLTVALFVSGEAFGQEPALASQAKMGALLTVGVAISAIVCSTIAGKMGFKAQAPQNESPQGTLVSDKDKDDEALEDVVVGDHVHGLKVIRQAQQAMEQQTDVTCREVVNQLNRGWSRSAEPRSTPGSTPSASDLEELGHHKTEDHNGFCSI